MVCPRVEALKWWIHPYKNLGRGCRIDERRCRRPIAVVRPNRIVFDVWVVLLAISVYPQHLPLPLEQFVSIFPTEDAESILTSVRELGTNIMDEASPCQIKLRLSTLQIPARPIYNHLIHHESSDTRKKEHQRFDKEPPSNHEAELADLEGKYVVI